MKRLRSGFLAAAGLIILAAAVAGCGHRLVAPPGETAVLVFSDRQTVGKAAQMIKQDGTMGALAAMGQTAQAKPIVQGTRVKVLSSDDSSVEILVANGPYKGLHGYVLKDAVK